MSGDVIEGEVRSLALARRRWKHWGLAIIGLSMATLCGCNRDSQRKPAFEKTVVDLGEVIQGEMLEGKVPFTNRSEVPIRITELQKACSCTAIRFVPPLLEPGKSGALIFKIATTGRVGEFGTLVALAWEDGKHKAKETVMIRANIKVAATISSRNSQPIDAPIGKGVRTAIFEIKRGDASLRWDSLTAKTEQCDVDVVRLNRDLFQVTVNIDPEANPIGRLTDKLAITLYDGSKPVGPKFTIPILVRITGLVRAEPEKLLLGIVLSGVETPTGTFKLISTGGPIRVNAVESSDPAILTATALSAPGQSLDLAYRLNPARSGDISGALIVRLEEVSSGRMMRIKIPWTAYCRSLSQPGK